MYKVVISFCLIYNVCITASFIFVNFQTILESVSSLLFKICVAFELYWWFYDELLASCL